MKCALTLAVSFILINFWGCENIISSSSANGLITEFSLQNPAGQITNVFKAGEDIRFHYSITNETGSAQEFMKPHPGPFVVFEVFFEDILIGASDDGFSYPAVVVRDTLNESGALQYEYDWLSVQLHGNLPPGKYVARARPILEFDDVSTPGSEEIAFTVLCDSTTQSCDSTDFVIITEQPADSLQLDAFVLNSVKIEDDILTLNISHSGGCKEHDYTLFMSPAVFLESYPTQANLFLRHNDHDDPCDAWLTTTIAFNIRQIADLYQSFYGRKDEIILNVFDYLEGQPGDKQSVSYFPQ